jgi:ElaB/YqjD/DUF883 family membrane-anchored ribosome-binding protein
MSQEKDDIRQEMDETRSSLTEKISALEERVVETVHDASVGVKETIELVKDAVGDSVEKVKETVGDTVDSVKETFSVTTQVQRRPWLAMAASVGVGFLAGHLLSPPARAASTPLPARPKRAGNGLHKEPPFRSTLVDEPVRESVGVVEKMAKTFENEINQLKSLAIGTLAGIVRDLVVPAVPEMVRNPINEVFSDVTSKLGGQMPAGRILSPDWHFGGAKKTDDELEQNPPYANPRQTAFRQY